MKKISLLVLGALFVLSCNTTTQDSSSKKSQTQEKSENKNKVSSLSIEAQKVISNLKKLADNGSVLVGHQATTVSSASGWRLSNFPDSMKCDFKDVCGKFPALYGWDFSTRPDNAKETYDYITYDKTIEQAIQAYNRGGLNTFSFHPYRLDNNNNSWDNTPGYVAKLLPGGALHDKYNKSLDIWIENFKKLKNNNGDPIPFIVRLYPEMDGFWFWWGTRACNDEEFKILFSYTVKYMRESGLNNMIVCYAPSMFNSEGDYLKRYPGDDVVDILGFDAFYKSADPNSNNGDADWNKFITKLRIVNRLATMRSKIAVVGETGQQNITSPNYFSQLMESINSSGARISYLMFWANYTNTVDPDGGAGYYVPYLGSSQRVKLDFKRFISNGKYMVEGEHPSLY